MKIEKLNLEYKNGHVGALIVRPADTLPTTVAVFTHGYTSHKGSLLNWVMRLSELNIASLVFDLPGHYLGTFSEIDSFDDFVKVGPSLFESGLKGLLKCIGKEAQDVNLILGGHSLGALMAIKASELPFLNTCLKQSLICVGFGLPPEGVTHVFSTPFYKSTLDARSQLVSPHLGPDVILPWIKEQKKGLKISGKSIFLLTGEDDVVVGKNGTEELERVLKKNGNEVILLKPNKLAHHVPENAAPHIKKLVKDYGL